LSGALTSPELPDYLSGLLIGAEIADAALEKGETVQIIASEALAERYQRALGQRGIESVLVNPDVVAAGHLQIARAAGLISNEEKA
jgi:2-dehydro-3-deoxygalactonokinase